MHQLPLAISPAPVPSFDNFLPGPNEAVRAALAAWAPGASAAPVYLWGPSGSGKTHLLRALAARALAGGATVGWFDAADPQPWHWLPSWSLVVVDGCERLNEAGQRAAFALFVEAAAQCTQFAAAGRLPPVDLTLRDDLRTRLAWGHVHALQHLDDDATRAVLRREADGRGIVLADEVIDHLLGRFPRDLGHLMRLLDALDDFALVHTRHVTVPLVRRMLAERGLGEGPAAGAWHDDARSPA
jgi:DnaA family protein